jgi:hypothetical protein
VANIATFVPGHSGGAVLDLHQLPCPILGHIKNNGFGPKNQKLFQNIIFFLAFNSFG